MLVLCLSLFFIGRGWLDIYGVFLHFYYLLLQAGQLVGVTGQPWFTALVQVMVSGSGHQVYGFYLSRLWLVAGAIYRSILVSCRVLALVPQASWFILYVVYHNG